MAKRAYVPCDADAGARILNACHQQTAAENTATAYLIDKPDEPVRKNRKEGQVGLYGRWTDWLDAAPHLAEIPQTIWRAGVLKAKARSAQWQETERQARRDHRRADRRRRAPAAEGPAADTFNPQTLFRVDASSTTFRRRNRVSVLAGVKRIDDHHVHVRGDRRYRAGTRFRRRWTCVRSQSSSGRPPQAGQDES